MSFGCFIIFKYFFIYFELIHHPVLKVKFIESIRENASNTIQSSYADHVLCVLDARDINYWDGHRLGLGTFLDCEKTETLF